MCRIVVLGTYGPARPADINLSELVINLKTAKVLGLTISRDFLPVTDEVIE